MSKKNHHPVSAEVENNPLYHDTYKPVSYTHLTLPTIA